MGFRIDAKVTEILKVAIENYSDGGKAVMIKKAGIDFRMAAFLKNSFLSFLYCSKLR